MEDILDKISEIYTPLSLVCQKDLIGYLKIQKIEKNTIVVREGQYADKAYFIIEGCARAYYLKEGRDISDWFAFENEFISSIVSFFDEQPSPHYIETLENSLVAEISREAIESLSNKYHDFERLIRVVVTRTMLSQKRANVLYFISKG